MNDPGRFGANICDCIAFALLPAPSSWHWSAETHLSAAADDLKIRSPIIEPRELEFENNFTIGDSKTTVHELEYGFTDWLKLGVGDRICSRSGARSSLRRHRARRLSATDAARPLLGRSRLVRRVRADRPARRSTRADLGAVGAEGSDAVRAGHATHGQCVVHERDGGGQRRAAGSPGRRPVAGSP